MNVNAKLHYLDNEIAVQTREVDRFEEEYSFEYRRATRLRCQLWYLWLADRTRRPSEQFSLWPVALLLNGPVVGGILVFGVAMFFTGTQTVAFFAGGLGGTLLLVVVYSLLNYPKVDALSARTTRVATLLSQSRERCRQLGLQRESSERRLKDLRSERDELEKSVLVDLERLAGESWRAMRGVDLENFLEKVFLAQGFEVQTTRATGDQGVDLVVVDHGVRIAIQVKGYLNSVGNDAVQQAVAGMKPYGCSNSAVISNSRFTPRATELARANGCVLIGEDEFEEFVLGRISLVEH